MKEKHMVSYIYKPMNSEDIERLLPDGLHEIPKTEPSEHFGNTLVVPIIPRTKVTVTIECEDPLVFENAPSEEHGIVESFPPSNLVFDQPDKKFGEKHFFEIAYRKHDILPIACFTGRRKMANSMKYASNAERDALRMLREDSITGGIYALNQVYRSLRGENTDNEYYGKSKLLTALGITSECKRPGNKTPNNEVRVSDEVSVLDSMDYDFLLKKYVENRRPVGDCKSISTLAVGFLRALGIKSRLVAGRLLTYDKDERVIDGYGHVWAEVYSPPRKSWALFDPAGGHIGEYPREEDVYYAFCSMPRFSGKGFFKLGINHSKI